MSLNTSNWKDFRFGDIITSIYKAKSFTKEAVEECLPSDNAVRFISRTDTNNGVDLVVKKPNVNSIEAPNAITIGDTTATVYYQDKPFICGEHMVVYRAPWMNMYTGLFIVALLKQERFRYSYGRAFVMQLISNTILRLPTANDGTPDWDFVESYMKTLHHKPLTTKNKKEDVLPLHPASWKKFRVGDLFYIRRGDRIIRNVDYCDNPSDAYKYPVITTTTTDNGIDGWYTQANCDGNCLVSGGEANGMFTTYQENPFWGLDTIRIYSPKGFIMNKYIALFLAAIFSQDMYRFSYGRKAKPDNMYSLNIKLPVTSIGDPDWQFMEDYIKSLPYGGRI